MGLRIPAINMKSRFTDMFPVGRLFAFSINLTTWKPDMGLLMGDPMPCYFDINTWHMASLSDMRSLWLGNTYTSPAMFNKTYETSTWDAWYGRYDSQSDSTHLYVAIAETQPQYNIYFNWALEIIPVHDNSIWADFDHINNSVIGAWVTSTAAVPEPSSIFLVLCGMPVVMIMLRRQGEKEKE